MPAFDAVLFDLDGTLVDSAPDLAGAANDLRAAHGLPPLPYEQLRPLAGTGARGMVGAAFGVAPGDARLRGAARRLPRPLPGPPAAGHARCSPPFSRCWRRWNNAGLPWGIVTNKALRLAEPLVQGLALLSARRGAGRRRQHAAHQAAPGATAGSGPAHRCGACPPASTWATTIATCIAGRAAGMATVAAAWGYLGARARPSRTGAPTSCSMHRMRSCIGCIWPKLTWALGPTLASTWVRSRRGACRAPVRS